MSGVAVDGYEAHARSLEARAAAEAESWERTLSPAARAKLGRFPARDYSKSFGVGAEEDLAATDMLSVSVDLCEQIDTEVEKLADDFGLNLQQATRLYALMEAQSAAVVAAAKAEQVAKIIGLLLEKHTRLQLVVEALALAHGMSELNGGGCQADVARRNGCTRALVSHYVTAWVDLLGLKNMTYCRSAETRERNRRARLDVMRRRKQNTK